MKIGIMSMQRIVNYGSFLQAYGLKKIIESLGHEVVFVDYHTDPPLFKDETLIKNVNHGNIVFLLKYYLKKLLRIPLYSVDVHKMTLRKIGVTETMHYNTKTDVLVIGSDEVFNCLQGNPDVGYSKELFGFSNNAEKLISYAASFGYTTADGLKKYGKYDEIKGLINDFDDLSVRDKNSFDLVLEMTGKEPSLNLDPVLIYDFKDEIINNNLKDYIIVYSYAGRIKDEKEIRAIQEFARKNGKKTVSVGNYQEWTDLKIQANAFELLGYIKNADYVVTDTFHGTVFSIIMRKQFATIIRDSNRQKLSALLSMLSLEDRELKNLSDITKTLKTPVDYGNAEAVLLKEKEHTLSYLSKNF